MYYSEEGIFFLSVTYTADYAAVTAKCFRRMKKLIPGIISQQILSWQINHWVGNAVVLLGIDGYCHHIISLFFYLAHCKQLGLKSRPNGPTCTRMKQWWSIPRGRKSNKGKFKTFWSRNLKWEQITQSLSNRLYIYHLDTMDCCIHLPLKDCLLCLLLQAFIPIKIIWLS